MHNRFFHTRSLIILASCALIPPVLFAVSIPAGGQDRPAVMQPAPDFTLPKLDGGEFSLSSLNGEKNAALVFYRGWIGHW